MFKLLGVKIKKVVTKQDYTIEELYEAIKGHNFSAGKPELTQHGLTQIITFPALGRNNQGWTAHAQMKKQCASMAVDMAPGTVTDVWSSFSGVFGKTAKNAGQLMEITAQELDSLGL